jgi:hypothetical protein
MTECPWLLPGSAAAITLVSLLIGFRLLWSGLRSPRRGDIPHCRRCDYPLVGLTPLPGEHCPECGTEFFGGNVVYGERPRRPVRAAFGVALVLFGFAVAGGYFRVRDIDWYPYHPTRWVISDLRSAATQDRAWEELQNRIERNRLSADQQARLADVSLDLVTTNTAGALNTAIYRHLTDCWLAGTLRPPQQDRFVGQLASDLCRSESEGRGLFRRLRTPDPTVTLDALEKRGLLSPEHHRTLTETALAQQIAEKPGDDVDWLMEYLGRRERDRALTEPQRDRFYAQAMGLRLDARRKLVAGDDLHYTIRGTGRRPREGWWHRLDCRIKLDGSIRRSEPITGGGGLAPEGVGAAIVIDEPGRHRFAVELVLFVYTGTDPFEMPEGEQIPEPRHERKVTLTADIEVLPPERADEAVRLIDDPSMMPAIRQAMRIWCVDSPNDTTQFNIGVYQSPAPVAFDIVARTGGKEIVIGTFASAKGDSHITAFLKEGMSLRRGDHVDVILRGSARAARKTPDLAEIWNGELIYPAIPVTAREN